MVWCIYLSFLLLISMDFYQSLVAFYLGCAKWYGVKSFKHFYFTWTRGLFTPKGRVNTLCCMCFTDLTKKRHLPEGRPFVLFMRKIKFIMFGLLEYCRKMTYTSMNINIIDNWNKIKCIIFLNGIF